MFVSGVRRFGLLLVAFGAAAGAVLVLSSAAYSAASMPLKGSLASTCTSSGSPCGTFAGRETPVGPFTGVITGVVAPGTGGCPSATNDCYTATTTAANGDQIYTFTASYVTGFDSSTGLIEFVQQINVVGGTGRFANATGTSTAFGEASLDLSTYHYSVSGTISL
jgi:hypothetical protein